jgi:hypothetical protein
LAQACIRDERHTVALEDHGAAFNMQITAAPIPEPETYAMLLAGLGLLAFIARRRRNESA